MTLAEARAILGLGPDEDPRPHLREFRVVRERLAELVRNAPDEGLADGYQQGLLDIDRALAAIREALEEPVPDAAPPVPVPVASPPQTRPRWWRRSLFVVCGCLLLAGAGAGWYHLRQAEQVRLDRMARAVLLDREAAEHILNRRWPEAAAAYAEIARLAPGSAMIRLGRRSIEAGMAEEQQQFAGYWTGQARAALEAGRWDEATAAARQVLEKFPGDQESAALLREIAAARATAARRAALARGRELLSRRQWQEASLAASELLAAYPDDAEGLALLEEATAALAQAAADLAQARNLYQQALARDHGQFDQQALDWLREATALAPEEREIAALFEKMASYTRTLRVPQDFPTPAEALANARARDRVILGEGVWKGPLIVNAAIELQGAGAGKTRIECPAQTGCVITLGPGAKGARLTGLAFRHESQTGEAERFSAGLIRGAAVNLLDCQFTSGCGHGLMVIEGGAATALRCRFADNGWNGAAAVGAGTALDIRESEASGNFENGLEAWSGAALTAVNNRCEANSRNGIHADTGAAPAVIEGNHLRRNREFGLVLTSATGGQVRNNPASGNLLGGMVVRAAARIPVTGNPLRENQGPGLILEQGLDPAAFRDNPTSGNTGKPVLGLEFSTVEPAR
jgi:parallel beta-helix repeat protein